ncbi:hypothetical protein HA402_015710 [Bradysia odoriphaga]|nr:hypothetical protein HA402_015710 [Bradysia odoriphaga]
MDFKPTLTFCGNGPLFRSIESHLVTSVPLDTCEWKRSYGRPVKNVRVEASFQPFDAKQLEKFKNDCWSITEQPVLHLYVTECDIDTYKSTVKEEIENWLKILTNHGIFDWMILLVETVDIKKTKNILPRTTVVDKMRLDFGAKHADRCISVLNPIKFEMKATESFRCLLQRIRFLMLTGYNRNIVKYEELIRTNREKRNQEGWSFIKYFLLQEQLAFVLEKLGLHMEALVQYDELDAMFSQFVLNSVFGEKHQWLKVFERQINDFNGITMNPKKMVETRKKIVDNSASILEFRSYVFERQAVLLNASDRQWEIAERLLPFLFATLKEVDALKNETPDGALACWQFVCALEVLNVCDRAVESKDMTNVFHHSAPIWNLAKDKLYELGKLCGLLPGFTPTSEQLHVVVQLSAGIGDSFLDDDTIVIETDRSHSPKRQVKLSSSDRLKEALGSNQAFQKLYLELSELAISTYKHVGRLRSARLVGLDLGNFYCTLSKPQKAVVFFTDLLRELKSEKWNYLASQTLLELASCFRKMEDFTAYTRTCGSISCCLDLEILVRTFYFDEFLLSLKTIKKPLNDDGSDDTIINGLEDHFHLLSIDVQNAAQIIQDDVIVAQLKIESHFPREILANQISVAYGTYDKLVVDSTKQNEMLSMSLHLDHKQDNSLSTASVVCTSKSQPINRRSSKLPQNVVRSDFNNEISTKNIVIKPGVNIIELQSKATRVGTWNFKQLSIVIDDKLEYLSDGFSVTQTPFEITTKAASAVLSFKNLVAGIKQPVKLIISGGSFIFPKSTTITLKCSKNLKIRSFENDCDSTFKPELSIRLENFKSFDEMTISLEVICELPGQRDEKYFEHSLSLHCPWSRNEIPIPLHFMPPFVASCRLHSSETRKYLQVIIKGTEAALTLSAAKMTCDYKGVNLKDQNPKSQNEIRIYQGLTVSYLWEIEVEPLKAENELPVIKVNFNVQYAHSDDPDDKRNFVCKFDVQDYTTLFRIYAKIESTELCRVGSVCHLNLSICKIQESSFGDLMYEVLPDQHTWAVCGRTAGVISSEGQSVILDILPLCAGFLPMPNVRLSKYIPAGRNEIHPKLEPFPPGQVYNATKSVQIHVLASATEGN